MRSLSRFSRPRPSRAQPAAELLAQRAANGEAETAPPAARGGQRQVLLDA